MQKVILYTHEESKMVVSKECSSCGQIKLIDNFDTTTAKGMIFMDCMPCTRRNGGKK